MKPYRKGNGDTTSEESFTRKDHQGATEISQVIARPAHSKSIRLDIEAGKEQDTPIRAGSSSKSMARDNKDESYSQANTQGNPRARKGASSKKDLIHHKAGDKIGKKGELQGRGGVNGYSADEERVAAAKPPKRAGASSQNVRSCKKLNANIDEKENLTPSSQSRSAQPTGQKVNSPVVTRNAGSNTDAVHDDDKAESIARRTKMFHAMRFMRENLEKHQIRNLPAEQVDILVREASTDLEDGNIPLGRAPYIGHLINEHDKEFRRGLGLEPSSIDNPVSDNHGTPGQGTVHQSMNLMESSVTPNQARRGPFHFQRPPPHPGMDTEMQIDPRLASTPSPYNYPRFGNNRGYNAGPQSSYAGIPSLYYAGHSVSPSSYGNPSAAGPSTPPPAFTPPRTSRWNEYLPNPRIPDSTNGFRGNGPSGYERNQR